MSLKAVTLKNIEKHIYKYNMLYFGSIYQISKKIRERIVVPFCNRHNLVYISGMGSWFFTTKGKCKTVDINKIKKFKYVLDILNAETMISEDHLDNDHTLDTEHVSLGDCIESYENMQLNVYDCNSSLGYKRLKKLKQYIP